ncbi:glycosyltransferase [Heliobacterium chlorum]|uniref:Glycosyltransferase n=1 Tax=Heliobacterium chlorum TaxID=2698 RepID=A0ABR7SYX3_HELCL|nr:glycosyltransferase [Heliobacterium chlorum]MBC9783739.1 glycosyltransferase [Heliobacterium chlorum]
MNSSSISLCLIARNEAEHIGRCLSSARDYVEEMIVIDTGSSDATIEIAQAMGAKVFLEPWQDDFSFARNKSLEKARGNWILVLDCDEELEEASATELINITTASAYEAYYLQIVNRIGSTLEICSPTVRLFRNKEQYRFTGRIHEQILPSLYKARGTNCVGTSSLKIIHYGYDPSKTHIHAKIQRNLQILENYPAKDRDGFFWYNKGSEYLRLGQIEEALSSFEQSLQLTSSLQQGYVPFLIKKLTAARMALGRYADALSHLTDYQKVFKGYRDLRYLEGMCHYHCGRYSQAYEIFESYLASSDSLQYPSETPFHGTSPAVFLDNVKKQRAFNSKLDITICIIGHDAVNEIGRCIQSIHELGEQVIYVDMGSLDETPGRAKQFGATVLQVPRTTPIVDARKKALAQAKGKWILMVNTNETLCAEGRKKISQLVATSDADGYIFKIESMLPGNPSIPRLTRKGMCRLFRKSETLAGTLTSADVTLYRCNDRDYDSAIQIFERCIQEKAEPKDAESCFYYVYALLQKSNYPLAIQTAQKAILLFPDYTDLYYFEAYAQLSLGNFQEAEASIRRCLQLGDAPWSRYVVLAGTGSYAAELLLGVLYAEKGDDSKAIDMFIKTLDQPDTSSQSVEQIVRIAERQSIPLKQYLEEYHLTSTYRLLICAKTLATLGLFEKSLTVLSTALGDWSQDRDELPLHLLQSVMEELLQRFHQQVCEALSESSPLRVFEM